MAMSMPLVGRRVTDGFVPPVVRRSPPMAEIERRSLGELFRYYRKEVNGISNMQDLADELGTSKDVLSNYETNKGIPEHRMMLNLIKRLGMPAEITLRLAGYPLGETAESDRHIDEAEAVLVGAPETDERNVALAALRLYKRSQRDSKQAG